MDSATHQTRQNDGDVVVVNGTGAGEQDVESLRKELDQVKEERDNLQGQYSALLTKVTNLRNSLGKKLQEDAEELDRRETEINSLQEDLGSLQSVNAALQSELESTASECTSLTTTLSATTSTLTSTQAELKATQTDLKRIQADLRHSEYDLVSRGEELERMRIQRDEWEREAERCKLDAEEVRNGTENLFKDVERLKVENESLQDQLTAERDEKMNLSSVLADFQDARDVELKNAVRDLDTQLTNATQNLAEWKSRALNAEVALDSSQSSSKRVAELETQVKEKTVLANKLRHEAVILNSHLTEALRRLRNNTQSQSTNVDRRLVSNVILQFLAIPRTDTKRFEILALLGSILEWGDGEKERAGLTRSHVSQPSSSSSATGLRSTFWSSSSSTDLPSASPTSPKSDFDASESFSKLWVEFLLTEAGGTSDSVASPTPSPTSPSAGVGRPSLSGLASPSPIGSGGGRRTASFTS